METPHIVRNQAVNHMWCAGPVAQNLVIVFGAQIFFTCWALMCRAVTATDAEQSGRPGKRARIFQDHLPFSVVNSGIRSWKYFQGPLRVNRFNPFEGWVTNSATQTVRCVP
jgi:hypothetical protein